MKKLSKATGVLVAGIVAAVGLSGIAAASVTFDPSSGSGFVGKGDVQIALGLNNAQLQDAVKKNSLSFTYSQPATEALSQVGTQAGAQSATETLTCTKTTVTPKKVIVLKRAGTRDGSREGIRSGERAGIRSGSLSSGVVYDARVKNQVTGFNLTGLKGAPTFAASGDVFGDWSFGDYSFGVWSWDDWTVDPVSSPGTGDANLTACVDHGAEYDLIVDDITEGEITDGDITPGAITAGDPTPTGSATLYINGHALN